ncbi:MAG: SIS domain-containing protein [Microcella sp.]|uniref:SIS domain-containing protein n=1 Tax=Microcella sp. TaxID=1913979 RepID=UPI0024C972E4|nr:SIS domain-containing protein [Microcella sp.]UYN84233.1 MAG: SIS domain-containing protein [Microcella sp.]
MDTARFADDLTQIPERYLALAEQLDHPDDGVDLLRATPHSRLLIIGMGSSRYAAAGVSRRARARGMVVWDELASTEQLPPPSHDLVVIAVSATGRSAEVITAAERFAGHGRLIAVTNDGESALAGMADAVSPLHAGVEVSGVASRTYRHTIVVLERLLALAESRDAARALTAAAQSSHALLESSAAWLDDLADLLLSAFGTHVLAPVERFGSAQQAALMIRELPRRLAVACETGDWAHVDLYTARTHDYRAGILAGSRWDSQAVEWLQLRGARYAGVGGEIDGAEITVRFDGDDDEAVRPLVETLPFELVADRWRAADPEFAFSERNGVTPPTD